MRRSFRRGLFLVVTLALVATAAWTAALFQARRMARREVRTVAEMLPADAKLAWGHVTANPVTRSMTVDDVALTLPCGAVLTADAVTVGGVVMGSGGVPRAMTVDASGVLVPPAPGLFGATAGVLDDLGYAEGVRLDLRLAYEFDPEADILTLKPLDLSAQDMGRMRLEATFARVDLEQWRTGFFLGTELVRANITYFDRSLAERVLVFTALATARGEGEVVAGWTAGLRRQAKLAREEQNERAARALTALVPFVQTRDGLAASLAPDEPVPLLYWYMGRNHRDMLELFNPDIRVLDQSKVKNDSYLQTENSNETA